MAISLRLASIADIDEIRRVYNEGIADKRTLDTDLKTVADLASWYAAHDDRYAVVVAELDGRFAGWASLNRYSPRIAHAGVADLSIYVDRPARRRGVGKALMIAIEARALCASFDKIVLMTFPFNPEGRALFKSRGFREVEVYRSQGRLDGKLVDTLAMDKILDLTASDTGVG